mgnify:CR=1 FL=1
MFYLVNKIIYIEFFFSVENEGKFYLEKNLIFTEFFINVKLGFPFFTKMKRN